MDPLFTLSYLMYPHTSIFNIDINLLSYITPLIILLLCKKKIFLIAKCLYLFDRLGFTRGCIEGCSWLVVQQEGKFCANIGHVHGQAGEDISWVQARSESWRQRTYFQVCFCDEEENGNWEPPCPKTGPNVKSRRKERCSSHMALWYVKFGGYFRRS